MAIIPGGRPPDRGMGAVAVGAAPKGTSLRLVKLLWSFYPAALPAVVLLVIFCSVVGAAPPVFMQKVVALLETSGVQWSEIVRHVLRLAAILAALYAASLIGTLIQGQMTAVITQGALLKLRVRMFDRMENLSQGQRQLIAIVRAAVTDPPVMILDEATSSIYTRTEAAVQRGMAALMKGRTVFVIAHRLSTVRSADVIAVLDHGRIIERGSHEELTALHGAYYRLSTGALELE